jgi:hypothetical protein
MTEWTAETIEQRIRDRRRDNTIPFVKTPRGELFFQTKPDVRPTPVVVQDVQIPFLSMVNFMVKWTLASIPALLILFVIGLICWGALLGPLVGVATHSH